MFRILSLRLSTLAENGVELLEFCNNSVNLLVCEGLNLRLDHPCDDERTDTHHNLRAKGSWGGRIGLDDVLDDGCDTHTADGADGELRDLHLVHCIAFL